MSSLQTNNNNDDKISGKVDELIENEKVIQEPKVFSKEFLDNDNSKWISSYKITYSDRHGKKRVYK